MPCIHHMAYPKCPHSLRKYFSENDIDLYKSKKVRLPKPELYVIYIGNRKTRPKEITLSEEFFHGEKTALEVTVKMIYDGKQGDIISQYVTFTRIFNEQIKLHDRTKTAILETIRICKDKDVLKEYLESKESEVVDIMMQLYDSLTSSSAISWDIENFLATFSTVSAKDLPNS